MLMLYTYRSIDIMKFAAKYTALCFSIFSHHHFSFLHFPPFLTYVCGAFEWIWKVFKKVNTSIILEVLLCY